MAESAGRQRRKFPRLEIPFDGRWDGAAGSRLVRIVSLSLGGCFIDGLGAPRVGEQLNVTISFPEAAPLALSGTVAYLAEPQGFAVQFSSDAPEQASLLVERLKECGLADPYAVDRG